MKLTKFIISVFILLIFITSGCSDSLKTGENAANEAGHLVQITKKQFVSDSMKIGAPTLQYFEDEIRCNGYIIAPANGMAQISAPLSGIVETINCSIGDYVRKGQILCSLSGNELMLLQQDFAETSAKLERLKSDYDRSKSLFNEKIGTEKDFIAIESDYKAMKSKYQSLKIRLELLKLNVSKIEAGELYSAFAVISPISGYITNLNLVLGQFTEQQKNLVEIIDVSQLQLQLSVFENDINKLKTGQNIGFNSLGEPASVHSAVLASIGKTINPESKTIQCLAKIKNENMDNYIYRSYIEARIIVNHKEAKALPNEAIIKAGKDFYVFVVEKYDNQMYDLRKEKITIGQVSKNFTEIIGGEDLTQVLIKGVYNLPVE